MSEHAIPQRRRARGWGLPVGLGIAALAVGGFAWLLLRAQELPSGPVPVAWDKTACAHCRMHVGEPGFAAQLQLRDGTVLNFDDPGCLVRWLDTRPRDATVDDVYAIYFHHQSEDRWLTRAEAGFVEAVPSPMGFGIAAVDAATPGAMTWPQAMAHVRAMPASGGGR